MKRIFFGILMMAAMAAPSFAQRKLQYSTATTVNLKLTRTDGSDETSPTITNISLKFIKHSDTLSNSVTTVACAASGTSHDCTHVANGIINVEVTSSDTDTPGDLEICPVYSGTVTGCQTFEVQPVLVYSQNTGTGISLPTNFSSLAITGAGKVTVGTNDDKTGYTASTVSDKTGYSLTSAYDPAKTAAQAGDAMTLTTGERNAAAAAFLATALATGVTVEEFMNGASAVLFGKAGGGGTDTIVFRDVIDTKNAVVCTVEPDGDRLSCTLNLD